VLKFPLYFYLRQYKLPRLDIKKATVPYFEFGYPNAQITYQGGFEQ